MKKCLLAGGVLCLLWVVTVGAAPKGSDMSCASLEFLNACALNGGIVSCSKGSINGRPETTAMCCKEGAGGSRVCSYDPNDIARGAVAPRALNADKRAPLRGREAGAPANPTGKRPIGR
ncbi:MAG: hypothetical protein DWQ09_13080 [Proteobacteria bacterium]|nr:MAG: hypothetical protein DWQ09_13080 [Pseudomonadota bacterium]QKK12538.1 MAG: hypothetical protein HND59_14060 [Pseudomonadota bacterium]